MNDAEARQAEENELEIQRRSIYLADRSVFCHAGGYRNFLAAGHLSELHPNYGLPCVGGWIYWEDGEVTFSERCVFCGGKPAMYDYGREPGKWEQDKPRELRNFYSGEKHGSAASKV
ncbi:MAG TPA: hypothetical protein VKW06_00395 [Candidatus Angelobacter sp.]|nr:hypothetical protein [Candidatus Angelobacter sp.]